MPLRRCLAGLLGLLALSATARPADPSPAKVFFPAAPSTDYGVPPVPLGSVAPEVRADVQAVLAQPTLSAKGPSETFNSNHAVYRWLLEHPDTGTKLWKSMGARVVDIVAHDGVYYWNDGQGSEMRWRIVYRDDSTHAWYADGKIKPGFLLPASPFRAFVVLKYDAGKDIKDRPAIRHQVHFLIRCDSRAMALAARILGASAPHIAEQYLGQLQMFYGALSWYLSQDTARANRLYHKAGLSAAELPSHQAQ